jgi:acyl-CoA dehydrogenase
MIDEELALVSASASDILAATVDRQLAPGCWDERSWGQLSEAGLLDIEGPDGDDGAGGTIRHAAEVVRAVGVHAAAVPVVEHTLVAVPLLVAAGLAVPDTVCTTALEADFELRGTDGSRRLRGRAGDVAFGRFARHVVLVAEGGSRQWVVAARVASASLAPGCNVAGEASDTLVFEDVPVSEAQIGVVSVSDVEQAVLRAALGRVLLIAAAADQIQAMTARYVTERQQFGRRLSQMQAVQQMFAALAAEATALRVSADTSLLHVADPAVDPWLVVAAAKANASQAATRIAAIAHQLHGAIGVTAEHDLRRYTTRLWAWRGADGSELTWSARIAQRLLEPGSPEFWEQVAGR